MNSIDTYLPVLPSTQIVNLRSSTTTGGGIIQEYVNYETEDRAIESLSDMVGNSLYFAPSEDNWTAVGEDHERMMIQMRLNFIKTCLPYLRELCRLSVVKMDEGSDSVLLDYLMLRDHVFKREDRLDLMIRDYPQLVIDCMGAAIYHILFGAGVRMRPRDANDVKFGDAHIIEERSKVTARLCNFSPMLPLSKLRAHLLGKFVSVRGTVIRVSNVRPLIKSMSFYCSACATTIKKYFDDGRVRIPTRCNTSNCKGKIEPLRNTAVSVDWQKIRVQEESDPSDHSGGVPKSAECELTMDMVETVVPGDMVTVCGIVKKYDDGSQNQQGGEKTVFYVYIDVNSIDSNKHTGGTVDTSNGGNSESSVKSKLANFSVKDMYGIREVAGQANIFKLIVHSMCPSIYGHEMVKAGLTLALFGGNPRNTESKNKLSIRGDPHVLIVGDPGLGKSQMLKSFQNISPRGVYVSGGYTSRAGLTVSLHKEQGSGDFALEAGALVLGDQGCCCIDEFDKMPKEHPALLEAMEQQSVSVAKAGVVCNLPARTSVIAAANPIGGHYNRAKTVAENIKMSAPLLSRFDLIFILLDSKSKDMDAIISDHIMDLHSVNGKRKQNSQKYITQRAESQQLSLMQGEKVPLATRLIVRPEEGLEALSPLVMRKYLGYAKKFVTPKLTSEAAAVIQEFYLGLRTRSSKYDSAPVTTRQLESLIRLAEARAKIELREYVNKEDAEDVVEIMKQSLLETLEDEHGKHDFRKSARGMSNASLAKQYLAAIERFAKSNSKRQLTKDDIFGAVNGKGLPTDNFDQILNSLNHEGMLLKSGRNLFSLAI
ncbi:MCM family protein [Cavenderia fasciculata]|uniref:Minichromosome maintenance 8 n=1 Tax=Cavenderia fasciculata TaxID=261658 RepID=F4Q0I8_CACFS|nr:MCM family protein [Cavenderia fasciculata]EGG18339.1 MCM family protein [Cavenderia fasciculata]|eukprot:XP_004366243.1 MCM family protein [Cavenderia fasciculata]